MPSEPPPVDDCDRRASLRPPAELSPPGQMPSGSTMARIARHGRLVVGVSQTTYLFGYRDPFSGTLVGLDIDIAHEIAAAIFGRPDRIQFWSTTSAQRIPFITSGHVDMVVRTSSMTCERWRQVSFCHLQRRRLADGIRGSGSAYSHRRPVAGPRGLRDHDGPRRTRPRSVRQRRARPDARGRRACRALPPMAGTGCYGTSGACGPLPRLVRKHLHGPGCSSTATLIGLPHLSADPALSVPCQRLPARQPAAAVSAVRPARAVAHNTGQRGPVTSRLGAEGARRRPGTVCARSSKPGGSSTGGPPPRR